METTDQVWRRWRKGLLVIAGIYGIGFAGAVGWVCYKQHVHSRWYRHVEYLILRLAPNRPAEVTPDQWAQCLQNTWNLHANYGAMQNLSEEECRAFVVDFERHLEGPISLHTIDAIWDDYGRHVPRARGYEHYRPTPPAMLERAAEEAKTQPADWLGWWIQRLKEREREMPVPHSE